MPNLTTVLVFLCQCTRTLVCVFVFNLQKKLLLESTNKHVVSDFRLKKNLTFFHSEIGYQCHLTLICLHCGFLTIWYLLPVSVVQCQSSTSSLAHFAFHWNQVPYSNLRPVQQFARLQRGSCKRGERRCSLWWKINVTIYFGLITPWDGSYCGSGYIWISSRSLLSFISADIAV